SSFNALKEPAEVDLFDEISTRNPIISSALERRDYRAAFSEAAKFGPGVDRFFREVFVMVDDGALRTARLALMKRLESVILSLADVSEIVAESRSSRFGLQVLSGIGHRRSVIGYRLSVIGYRLSVIGPRTSYRERSERDG